MPERKNNKIEMGGIDLNPGDRIGVYRYERPIGKGGMAEVLLAYDPNDQPMALKVLKASRFRTGRRRFRREFRALAKLRHPNVIQVDSFGDIFGASWQHFASFRKVFGDCSGDANASLSDLLRY